jgi:hypothetical protein
LVVGFGLTRGLAALCRVRAVLPLLAAALPLLCDTTWALLLPPPFFWEPGLAADAPEAANARIALPTHNEYRMCFITFPPFCPYLILTDAGGKLFNIVN